MSGANRAPSSSVKNATWIGRRVVMSCLARVSTISNPASTPRLPSNRPPVRTVSMCEPTITAAAVGSLPARVATTLPMASIETCMPRSTHPRHDQIPTVTVGIGQRQPGAASLAVRAVDGADLTERLEPLPQTGRRRCARRSSRPSSAPEIESRDLAERIAERATPSRRTVLRHVRPSPPSGRRCTPSGWKSFDSHPKLTRPPKRTYALPASLSGTRRVALLMSHRPGARCSMIGGLVGAAVHAHPQLAGRRRAALIDRHTRVGEERHQPVREPQFAVGDVEQRAVASVTVEEDESLRRGRGDAAADVVEHRQQGRGRQPHRARRPGVLVRLRVLQRRHQPDVELVADLGDRGLGDSRGDDRVGAEWQVRAVLFDGPEGLDDDAALVEPRRRPVGRRGSGSSARPRSHGHVTPTCHRPE